MVSFSPLGETGKGVKFLTDAILSPNKYYAGLQFH